MGKASCGVVTHLHDYHAGRRLSQGPPTPVFGGGAIAVMELNAEGLVLGLR
jgi:hypothetical protein